MDLFSYLIFYPQFKTNVSYIYIDLFILYLHITNSQYDQIPVGLIAQLLENCTGIAAVMGSNQQALPNHLLKQINDDRPQCCRR